MCIDGISAVCMIALASNWIGQSCILVLYYTFNIIRLLKMPMLNPLCNYLYIFHQISLLCFTGVTIYGKILF